SLKAAAAGAQLTAPAKWWCRCSSIGCDLSARVRPYFVSATRRDASVLMETFLRKDLSNHAATKVTLFSQLSSMGHPNIPTRLTQNCSAQTILGVPMDVISHLRTEPGRSSIEMSTQSRKKCSDG